MTAASDINRVMSDSQITIAKMLRGPKLRVMLLMLFASTLLIMYSSKSSTRLDMPQQLVLKEEAEKIDSHRIQDEGINNVAQSLLNLSDHRLTAGSQLSAQRVIHPAGPQLVINLHEADRQVLPETGPLSVQRKPLQIAPSSETGPQRLQNSQNVGARGKIVIHQGRNPAPARPLVFVKKSVYDFSHNYSMNMLMQPVDQSEYPEIHIDFVPLGYSYRNCMRPKMLPQFRNPCWLRCSPDINCSSITHVDLKTNMPQFYPTSKIQLVCAPRVILMGIRKCGTSDIWRWFSAHSEVLDYNIDYDLHHYQRQCGASHADRQWQAFAIKRALALPRQKLATITLYLDAPGQILYHHLISHKDNIFRVNYAMQLFKEFEIEETRYIISLRDPSERAISQLFEWHGHKDAFRGWDLSEITPQVIHNIVAIQLERVKTCFRLHSPKGCLFLTPAADGNFDTLLLWGLYANYLELAFKFTDRTKWYINLLSEYSNAEVDSMKKIFEFSGLPYENRGRNENKTINHRVKAKPLDETMVALRNFYQPFNLQLATLLNDKKWLFLDLTT